MTQFWTFSGINSWSEDDGAYIDYTWQFLEGKLHPAPTRRYASRLGTTEHYDKAHYLIGIDSESKLDREAEAMDREGGGFPPLATGALKDKNVKVLLVAPKTTTKPPNPDGLFVEVLWSPNDHVPNQKPISPDTLGFWRKYVRGGGQVWPVENRVGQGTRKGHDYKGFMVDAPKILKRKRVKSPVDKQGRYVWRHTGKVAPSPIETLRGWLNEPSSDYVFLAHSQGTNIAAHFLHRGYAS